MVAIEYLGGLPGRPDAAPIVATVAGRALQFKRRGFLRGWSSQLPLGAIASAELTTAEALRSRGVLPPPGGALPEQAREYFLAIEATPEADAVSIVLRGSWAAVDGLRQEILKGRQRAVRKWRS